MSYSRWTHSKWYSFWASSNSTEKNKQILSLWYSLDVNDTIDFIYEELIMMDVISQLQGYYESTLSLDDIEEAKKIIEWFIEDVNEDYGNDDETEIR